MVSRVCIGNRSIDDDSWFNNYSIDLTGVTAQNSAITTAIVSALQTASVGTSVSTFSVQDSSDTITPQREFKISSAGTSFQIQFTRQDETTTVSLTDNLNIFTSGATNLTTIRDYDNNQNAKSTARATIDALVAGGEYEEVGAAKAQQIDFSGILVCRSRYAGYVIIANDIRECWRKCLRF